MKNMKNLLFVAIIVLGFSAASFGQDRQAATASATATIVVPIQITKDVDMNFGNVAVNGNLAGTVVLPPTGVRTVTGGVTLPAVPGTVSSAQFTITGTTGYLYTMTLPSTATTVTSGASNMTIDVFTKNGTGVLTGGTEVINVGATLNVGATQAAGTYTSGTSFAVRVDYN